MEAMEEKRKLGDIVVEGAGEVNVTELSDGGRTYVRNGSVCHLEIESGQCSAP